MGEVKFTPGPWHVVHNGSYREINLGDCECSPSIAQVCPSQFLEAGDNEEANAHLIAEAPELYRVAEMALNAIQRLAEEHGAIPDYLDDITGPIDAALAKARGE